MKQLILIIALALLTSCGLTRHVTKDSTEAQVKTSDQSVHEVRTEDKTVTTVTELADTAITVIGQKIVSESAGTTARAETDDGVLTSSYDKASNTIRQEFTPKPRKVPVKVARKVEVKADVVTTEQKRNDITTDVTIAETHKDKQSKTSWLWAYIAGAVVVVGAVWVFRKKIPL